VPVPIATGISIFAAVAGVLRARAERRVRAAVVVRQLPRLLRRAAPLPTTLPRRRRHLVHRPTNRPSARPTRTLGHVTGSRPVD